MTYLCFVGPRRRESCDASGEEASCIRGRVPAAAVNLPKVDNFQTPPSLGNAADDDDAWCASAAFFIRHNSRQHLLVISSDSVRMLKPHVYHLSMPFW